MMRTLTRTVLTAALLYAFWLLLSGNYQAWLVISGLGASIMVVALSQAKGVLDGEGFPLEDLPRALLYWPWLIGQIVLSALNVTRLILDPRLPISPSLTAVTAREQGPVGLTTYANSITLTPGTITVEVAERDRTVWVHAITRENAEGLAGDPMRAWVDWMEGTEPPAAVGAGAVRAKEGR